MFFGKIVEGKPSPFYFSGVIISKIPLALLTMVLLGLGILIKEFWRHYRTKGSSFNRQQFLTITFLGAFICAHLLVLAMGRTMYGGIRHALPVVAGLGVLAGAIVWLKIPKLASFSALIPASLFGIALIMTIGEKRIYEYYNEIVGGTENAYKCFCDEGGYLGQRFYETKAFFEQSEIDSTEPISAWMWFMEEEWKSENLDFDSGAVKDIYDNRNEEGLMSGYYLIGMCTYNKWPNWDPSKITHLETKKRIGQVNIAYGEIKDPEHWAASMFDKVMEYLEENKNPDWNLVAKRTRRITELIPWATTSYVLLGNACVRTGKKEEAIAAYQKLMANMDAKDPYQKALKDQVAKIEKTDDLASIENLRPASLE